jgi:hypothetical protein
MARKTKSTNTALVVTDDLGLRESLENWLEADGFEAMGCPGPSAPDFTCVGLRGEHCPLVGAADVVLLDLHPEPGELLDQTRRGELVDYYQHNGRHLVVMVDTPTTLDLPDANGAVVIGRITERAALIDTVHEVLGL